MRRLGAGGNGVVWLATHLGMAADAVLKFPHSQMFEDEAGRSQFEKEIRSLVAFSNRHPNIVNVLDVGQHHGRPFVAMQYLTRGSLLGFVYQSEGFNLREAVKLHETAGWLYYIADALDFIHGKGLLHCDIKPSNILLDDSFSAYLADFGIATLELGDGSRSSQSANRQSSHVIGSLPYMAPELLLGHDSSPAADQFSLAVTAYEYLTGKRPFNAANPEELLELQEQSGQVPIHGHRPDLPVEMSHTIARAMSLNPTHRFENCRVFAKEVARWWMFSPSRQPLVTKPPLPSSETGGATRTIEQTQLGPKTEGRKIKLSRVLRKKRD